MTNNPENMKSRKLRWKFIERQLRDYPINKSLIEHYRQGGESIAPVTSCLRLLPGNSQGKKISSTEKQALELVDLAQHIAKISWYVAAIDDLLSIASAEEKSLLQARYFQPRPQTAWQVANELFISRTEFYRRRDLLLCWLEKRFGLLTEEIDYPLPAQTAL